MKNKISVVEPHIPETPEQYAERLLGHVQGKDPLRVQREAPKKLGALLRGLSRRQLTRKPAPDKWSIAEILAHLADTEIVVAWRLRHILGNNGASIQAYDQNAWAETFDYVHRDANESLEFFRTLRARNLALLKALPKKLWENYGLHQERGRESVVLIVRLYAGHDLNHLGQVERIVKDNRKSTAGSPLRSQARHEARLQPS